MIRWTISYYLILFSAAWTPAIAQEIGFIEDFALAENRDEALKKLVPGTQEYYYFHALHFQNSGDLEKVDEFLKPWLKRYGKTREVQVIQNRQALLRFDESPGVTWKYLQDRLNLNFNQQREIPSTERNLPSRLDQKLISAKRLMSVALRRHSNTSGVTDSGLEHIDVAKLNRDRRRHLLSRVTFPDFPELVSLIVKDLREKDSGGFGSLNVHNRLTIEQMELCLKEIPKLIGDSPFINAYLAKLHPNDDVNWRADRKEHREYLNRLHKFTSRLSPANNSLKACVVYRMLELDQMEGRYDRKVFFEYLQLPRNTGYVNPQLVKNLESRSHVVNLGADFRSQIRLVPIFNDEPLVQQYLHHFLLKAKNYDAFSPYIRDSFLKKQFATVKILNGQGNPEQWASMLSPEDYKQLLARVDLDFSPTNTEFFADEDVVEIELLTKNVPALIVKIFEINTSNFYRKYQREIDTDVNLDGLVPNSEETHKYDDDPALRVRRSFTFDKLTDSGVYVIDFIGGGKSSRALVRRGRLSMVAKPTVAGQQFRIYDQNYDRVRDAFLWISGRQYLSDEDGVVTVPFSNRPAGGSAVITRNGFSSLQKFEQQAERYSLEAAMYVDRESLLFNDQTDLIIRPRLRVAGIPTSVKLLSDVQLIITSVNHSGISSTKRIDELKLHDDAETICEFVVPPRLRSIKFDLIAKVENVSGNKEESLSASRQYEMNLLDTSDEIQDVHLMPTNNGYFLEVRGKSGESRRKQAVRILLSHQDFKDPVAVDLQSNANGQIDLGELDGISSFEATLAAGSSRKWNLDRQTTTIPRSLISPVSEVVQIAAPIGLKAISRNEVSLFEKRRGQIVTDRFDRISMKSGIVELTKLEPGDYTLRFKRIRRTVNISVVEGKQDAGVVIGSHRRAELRGRRPLALEEIKSNGGKLEIQLRNSNSLSRLHVIASRYQPRFESFSEFSRVRGIQPWIQIASLRRSAYMSGRKLGDEFQYILNRRYAPKYAGNMLARPSLLVNPWAIRDTQNNIEMLEDGDEFADAGTEDDRKASREAESMQEEASKSDFANLDFLAGGSLILSNLKPDEEEVVSVELKKLNGLQNIRVIAVDANSTVEKSIRLAAKDIELRDLRLAHALAPAEHYSQAKKIEILSEGDVLTIEDLISGRFQYFDDLSDVFRLYLMLNPNTRLAEFEFILDWNQKSDEEKRKLYSKFACHELNFYLYKKDRAFFDNVVQPHIGYKLEQGLIDQFLSEKDLSTHVEPWQFAKLNVVERILLSQRMEDRSADIVRSLDDLYLLNPTKREFFDSLYDRSIRTDVLFFSEARKRKNFASDDELPKLAMVRARMQAQNEVAAADESGGGGRGGAVYDGGAPVGGVQFGVHAGQRESKFKDVRKSRDNTDSVHLGFDIQAGKSVSKSKAGNDSFARRSLAQNQLKEDLKHPADGPVSAGVSIRGDFAVDADEIRASEKLIRLRDKTRALYRRLQPTRELVEQQYYGLPLEQQRPDLVSTNRFWRDYSKHRGGSFLSPYFSEAHQTLTEMMFALAVLDLPEKAPDHKFEYTDNSMKLTAADSMIALHQQFQPTVFERGNTTILVAENFFQKNDRYKHEEGVQYDKFVNDKFYAHTLYGAQVVLTNPTSTPQAIDLLVQIPKGSVASSGSQETQSLQIQLNAFSTKTLEYHFYFPTAGDFTHYPAHVSRDNIVLAVADGREFKVIDVPAEVDRTSWEYVSQNGTIDNVFDFLTQKNVLRIDLGKIAFRMKDKPFFEKAIEILRNRYTYHHTLWSYGIKHKDDKASREFLDHEDRIAAQVGRYFQSPLLDVIPCERNWYQHREYSPLVNARIHQVGAKRKILNPAFHQQYHQLLDLLSNRTSLSSDERLVVSYYMLLQDRIDEALYHFAKVDKSDLNEQMQYDYCDAYLDFYLEDPNAAEKKAQKWAEYPVDLWRNRFKNILTQVAEVRGGSVSVTDKRDDTQKQTELAAASPSFDFEIESSTVKITAQNLTNAAVNFYEMDIELMFSRSPFAEKDLDGFSVIRPNSSLEINLEPDGNLATADFEIPAEFKNKNVLVEINAGDQIHAKPYFASSMAVQAIEKYGQLKITADEKKQPIAKAYVKVYSLSNEGQIRFHKDGYTDLRGRFDYVSQSNNPLDNIQKYSILVLSPEHGAVTRQVKPPAE